MIEITEEQIKAKLAEAPPGGLTRAQAIAILTTQAEQDAAAPPVSEKPKAKGK